MSYSSFRQDFKAPLPPRSRTPERIASEVESIPEVAFAVAELLKRDNTSRKPTTRTTRKPNPALRGSKASLSRVPRHSHSHSASFAVPPASPIDTLASVAAFEATARSPPTFHNLYQSQYPLERASKRARSEIAPSPHQPTTSPLFDHGVTHRPATSYNYNGWSYNVEQGINNGQRMRTFSHTRSGSANGAYPESNVDEAELLLNFSRGGSISSSHGLGILVSTAEIQPTQRTPALPPFPFAPLEQTTKIPPVAPQELAKQEAAAVPTHDSLSPPTNSNAPTDASVEIPTAPQQPERGRSAVLPSHDTEIIPKYTKQSPVETKAKDIEMIDAGELPAEQGLGIDFAVQEDPIPSANTQPVTLTKLGALPNTADIDNRRYSDSHQSNPLKRVRLDVSRRSSSVPLDYAVSETTEPSTTAETQTNADESFKLHEQGVVCPSCKNAADVTSEKVDWLQCDGCDQWYHVACSGLTAKQSKIIDKYYCKPCEPKFGKSTSKCYLPILKSVTHIWFQRNVHLPASAQLSTMLASTKASCACLARVANTITLSR